ncbi:MAG: glycosyltransferase, partial [Patescibacteria group bacterium]
MKIGIDARMFGPETGIGRYTENLIRNLELVDRKNEYVIFLSPEKFSAYVPAAKNFTRVIAKSRWYSFREQIEMPRLINQAKVNLMHFSHFNVPLLCSAPFVVSIHDLILLDFPTARATTMGPLFYWLKYKIAYPLVIRNAVSRAKTIITMAKYTKERIVEVFKINPEKIKIIYEGVADSVRQTAYDTPPKKITKSFLLCVGNAYPHKNLEGLVDAFLDLKNPSPTLPLGKGEGLSSPFAKGDRGGFDYQ